MNLLIATRNQKKKEELERYLEGLDLKILSLDDFDNVPIIEEDGKTFRENAVKKAVTTAKITGELTLADDSGLEVDILGGAPGIISARFAGEEQDDLKNNRKLLEMLARVPDEKRGAQFVCAVAIADKDGLVGTVEEDCRGIISGSMRGGYGFGYDSVFIISEYSKTFGELGAEVKDRISHRAKALARAREVIEKYLYDIRHTQYARRNGV